MTASTRIGLAPGRFFSENLRRQLGKKVGIHEGAPAVWLDADPVEEPRALEFDGTDVDLERCAAAMLEFEILEFLAIHPEGDLVVVVNSEGFEYPRYLGIAVGPEARRRFEAFEPGAVVG